jgi:hypothetical protein
MPLVALTWGRMLAWSKLSMKQKAGAAFLALLFLFSGPGLLYVASTTPDLLKTAGSLLCGIGVLLAPSSFSRSFGAPLQFTKMPVVSRLFLGAGLLSLVAAWVATVV